VARRRFIRFKQWSLSRGSGQDKKSRGKDIPGLSKQVMDNFYFESQRRYDKKQP
jgi:hypothetical protein